LEQAPRRGAVSNLHWYKIVRLEQYNNGFRKHYSGSNVYAVIELGKKEIENIEEIDTSLICHY
jgi:hypothetical protein